MEQGIAKTITTKAETVPVYKEADIIVVGGGIAGIAAAIAASRQGKSVILLEKNVALGGLATLGHVCIYLPLDDYTSQLYIGKRFATSTMKDAYYRDVLVVYRTTEFDDSSENYGEDKLLVMKCVSDQYNPEKDNFDLMI